MNIVLSADDPEAIDRALNALPFAKAVTATFNIAADDIRSKCRADIASAGFGDRWVSGLRVKVYPTGGKSSLSPEIFVSHSIPYAGVFEEGASIAGRPYLWIPLPGTPATIDGRPTTASLYASTVAKLFFLKGPGGKPLLCRRVGKKLVPLFVGLTNVEIRKRFHIEDIVRSVSDTLSDTFDSQSTDDPNA